MLVAGEGALGCGEGIGFEADHYDLVGAFA
jgi:hypothetical protein